MSLFLDRSLQRERRAGVYFRRLSRQLTRACDEAVAAARAKAEFLASLSHEIRTPMNGIIATTELLESSKLSAQQLGHAQTIRRSGEALLAIINDVLDFSKIEAGKMQLASAAFDPVNAADAVIQLPRPLGRQKGLEVRLIAPADTPRAVLGDETRIRQILMNLVGNAIKFTRHGSVRVEVAPLAADAGEVELRFSVVDTRIGISQADQAQLFDRFSATSRSTGSRFGGTGLGLSICKRLAELMGGTIAVESTPGRGSRFSAIVKLASAKDITVAPLSQEQEAPPSNTGFAARIQRVLVVEDYETNQNVARQIIEKAGHAVELVGTGAGAVELVQQRAFDVILLDLHLPDMSGFVVASSIRALSPPRGDTPIVAATADVMGDVAQRCKAADMDGYLAKPYRVRDLTALLARWAARSSYCRRRRRSRMVSSIRGCWKS
ncbi:MAG: response regulator [Alphaproteobacteria bacterium]|nr:response regulator [Alphaproteobacteria bacterium]